MHQAGLHGYLPFWANTKKNNKLDSTYFRKEKSAEFPFIVAKGIYGNQVFKRFVMGLGEKTPPMISRRSKHGEYPFLYSDLGFNHFCKKIVEKVSGFSLDVFCENTFYKPLGLERTGFNISEKISVDQIAPTENDMVFRGYSYKVLYKTSRLLCLVVWRVMLVYLAACMI